MATMASSPGRRFFWDGATDMSRIEIIEVERILLNVIKPEAIPEWWDTPLPRLHNATGRQMIAGGDGERLLAYVRTYLDESFS